ncbi:MAG TPA: hypothetical protein GX406_08260 [Pseudoclavibacter sp.]|nr:hypothetical protein [Pseudoclavibacter sp.]
MAEFLAHGPFALVFAFLTIVVFLRAQATFALGWWSAELTARHAHPRTTWGSRVVAWLRSPATEPGIRALHKWGLPVIPLSFLTIGFQTLANAGAGLIRMPWWKYTLAMIPGCLAWALIYSTIGFAVWEAALGAAAGSPWGITVLCVSGAALAAAFVVKRRRRLVGSGR